MNNIYLSLIVTFLLTSCQFYGKKKYDTHVFSERNSYAYHQPSRVFTLHSDLVEISGLTFDAPRNEWIVVNDEKGKLFVLDGKNGKIKEDIPFHKDADFEGVELVNNSIWVLKSNGKLFELIPDDKGSYDTPLSYDNDVEGLGFDADAQVLLLACKEKALEKDHKKNHKVIYAFDLDDKSFIKTPYLIIDWDDLKDFLNEYDPNDKLKDRARLFAPSAIAKHPISKQLYVLSARGSLMLVFNQELQVEEVVFLDEAKIPQPEGICFKPDGTLCISTEGQKDKAKLFVFKAIEP